MAPVLTKEPRSARPRARPFVLAAIAAVVLVVAALIFSAVGGPEFADRLTVHNSNATPLDVEVGRPGSDKVLPLGEVRASESRVFEHIVDQGDHWELRFYRAGEPAGTLALTADQLEARQWKVEAPRVEISP